MNILKSLPHSLESEQSVVSSVLQLPSIIERLPVGICEAIYTPSLKLIFGIASDLIDAEIPPDPAAIIERLRDQNKLDSVGGAVAIANLIDYAPAPTHASHHAKRVIQDSVRRKMIALSESVVAAAYDSSQDFDSVRDRLQQGALEIELEGGRESMGRDLSVCILEAMDRAQELAASGGLLGLPSGIPLLDHYTTGFRPGLNVICGRPSMGKSAFALQCAIAAVDAGNNIGFFSLEMEGAETGERAVAHMSGVSLNELAAGRATEADKKAAGEVMKRIPRGAFTVDDHPGRSLSDIRRISRHWVRNNDVKGIFVDQLSFLDAPATKMDNQVTIIGKITRGLHNMGKALNIPVILLAQLNREAEGKRPDKSHLKSSGSIEEDARLILSPYRDDPNDPSNQKAEIIPLKTRGVSMFKPVQCIWEGNRQTFREATHEEMKVEDF